MLEIAGTDKWLMGTDELTQLDIHCGAQWDFMYTAFKSAGFADAAPRLNIEETSPKWCAYMRRLRAHPKIAPVCMNQEAMDRHTVRTRGWEQGVKCQLTLEVMMGLYPDMP